MSDSKHSSVDVVQIARCCLAWFFWQYFVFCYCSKMAMKSEHMLFLDQELISYRYSTCLLLFFICWGDIFQKCLRFHHFKSGCDEIWQDCSSNKYASIDRVEFLMSDVTLWRWRPWRNFTHNSADTWWVNMQHLLGTYAAAFSSSCTR